MTRWIPSIPVLLLLGGIWVLPGSLTAGADQEQNSEQRARELFDRYWEEQIPRTVFLHGLDHLEGSVRNSILPIIEDDHKHLEEHLGTDRLEKEVIPDLRETHEQLRNRVTAYILDQEKYTSDPDNEEFRLRLWNAEQELEWIHEEPFSYYMLKVSDLEYHFARAQVFLLYLDKQDEIESDQVESSADRLETLLDEAGQIVHPDSVGLAGALQPYREENSTIRQANDEGMRGMTVREKRVVRQVNQYREMMGLRRLRVDLRLVKSARSHSREMKRRGYFSHISPVSDNRTVTDRATNAGFVPNIIGENIARGKHRPEEVIREWRRSPDHHRNLIRTEYRYVGSGIHEEYWTLVMAGPPGRESDSD